MASFGEGLVSGMQIGDMFRKRQSEQSIDDAGREVAEEMRREKEFKAQQKKQLADNATSTDTKPVDPSIYQQGDSLGMQGYKVGNKPIQTTVPIAPPGYMSRPGEEVTPGIDTNGYYEPELNTSANPATDQTLIGNYNTAAALRGEKPTREDSLRMQQEPTQAYDTTSVDEKTKATTIKTVPGAFPIDGASVVDLAQIKAEVAPQVNATPKMLDTLNDQVGVADLAKDSYEFSLRVTRNLENKGDVRGAASYKKMLAESELTLAQANGAKFTTIAAASKMGGETATNALEAMQAEGADINKIYFDWATDLKERLGYSGKIAFSLDPKENMKTIQNFANNAISAENRAELGIKQTVATYERSIKNSKDRRDEEELTLKKLAEARAQGKDVREEAQAVFNRYAKEVEITQKAMDSLNPYQDKETKTRYAEDQKALIVKMKEYTNVFGLKPSDMGNVKPGATGATVNSQPGTTPANTPANTQPDNTRFGESTSATMEGKPITDTAGGYITPTPKTPAEEKDKAAKIKALQSKIYKLQPITKTPYSSPARFNPISDAYDLGGKAVSSVVNSDLLNPSKAGQKQRDRKAKELKKLQDELDALTNS